MLYIVAVAIGIIAGKLAGGKIANLAELKLEKTWIIITAFLIQATAQILGLNGFGFISRYSFVIQAIVFCLLFSGFWINRRYLGILFIGIGCLLNALVMMFNGGKMPVKESILISQGATPEIIEQVRLGLDGKHSLINDSTRLVFLSDIIETPPVLDWMMQIISLGDIIVVIGLCVLIFEVTKDGNAPYKAGGFNSEKAN